MITRDRFLGIRKEVEDALTLTLNYIRNANEEAYVLLLARGEYHPEYNANRFNPNTIDNAIDGFKDLSRKKFLVEFLTKYYSFDGVTEIDNDTYRMNIEMMIYTHIWESNPFLKELFRFTDIYLGNTFSWTVKMPKKSKKNFIQQKIHNAIEKHCISIATIVSNGYCEQLRNAFAHFDFSIEENGSEYDIVLHNYDSRNPDLKKGISFDEWSEYFAYSFLLSYLLIIADLGKDKFEITLPKADGSVERVNIYYNPEADSFSFVR
jgi:hypothetical protein